METLKDIYKAGRDRGLEFGKYAVNEFDEAWWKVSGTTGKGYGYDDLDEVRRDQAYESEENARQYSPFEFTAKKLNDFGYNGDDGEDDRPFYAEEAWIAFDDGICKGVEIALYLDDRKTRKA